MSQVSEEEKQKAEGMNLFKITTIMREDLMLKMPIFHENGKEDPQQHWFVCEAIWSAK